MTNTLLPDPLSIVHIYIYRPNIASTHVVDTRNQQDSSSELRQLCRKKISLGYKTRKSYWNSRRAVVPYFISPLRLVKGGTTDWCSLLKTYITMSLQW